MSNDNESTGLSDPGARDEFLTLAGIGGAVSASATVGSKIWEIIKSEGPFVVSVDDSCNKDGSYIVDLKLRNLDINATYVEKIEVEEPLKLMEVGDLSSVDTFGYNKRRKPLGGLPYLIPSGGNAVFRLVLAESTDDVKYGIARIEISRLGEKSSEKKKVRFLIRTTRNHKNST